MAALVVQSRFAGLKVEDDDNPSSVDNQKTKKVKTNTAKKPEPVKKIKSNTKQQSAGKKKKSKQNTATSEQWETWKQKDEELVDGHFELELQQAILLSKLDYEEKKDVYKQMKKEAEIEKKAIVQTSKAGSKKQKKKNVMSLDQFNDMMKGGDEPKPSYDDYDDSSNDDPKSPDKDTEFFERVKDDAKCELLKDQIKDKIRHRQTLSNELITRVQFADALERKNKEIAALRQEVTSLKQELLTVKSRNKKLCNILGQGEMKDKAEVLIEVERLRAVQAELTAELAALHTDLEKERSRNADPRTKDKKKKCGNGDKEK
ncbi:G kinase-anchoring protein 1-like isoform X2 [Plodia interpunctella]|uniref:G kinase-anchoring protein 1-like isoform X2 n=1 Tax=Plodia interpunctella TaxID=58824 RepID=UPI002368A075|nr:G kinase-anchoring protein 1-like isoform X2 [Plodia interpunctella]XP_053611879.1 G kinase-anchoring protein 1-like isoform X2 [Plodia interpunctella]